MDRAILHVDANCFYASVECFSNPDIRNKPVAVVGNIEKRHGIVLTANYIAKRRYNIKTGDVVFEAKIKCPSLVVIEADMPLYIKFSKHFKKILQRYSDLVEDFGCDEAWLDVTNSKQLFGSGEEIAKKISDTVKYELGITVSVGVSFNKVFAKLGSDMKKPDGITVISRDNYREKVWSLPVSDLLYVGRKTNEKLLAKNIKTIGELAQTPVKYLTSWFGKNGIMLHDFANGNEYSPVSKFSEQTSVKSIGNSTTTERDLLNNDDVKMVMYVLADSVARRLREKKLYAKTVTIFVKTNQLDGFSKQCTLSFRTNTEREISDAAFKLFINSYSWYYPIRALGITVSDLSKKKELPQFDIYGDVQRRINTEILEKAEDELKSRFGSFCVRRGVLLNDSVLTEFDPKATHTVHPESWF